MNRTQFMFAAASTTCLLGAAPAGLVLRRRPSAATSGGTMFSGTVRLPPKATLIAEWNAKYPSNPLSEPVCPEGNCDATPPPTSDPGGSATSDVIAYLQPQFQGFYLQSTVTFTGPDWGNLDGTAFTITGPGYGIPVSYRCLKNAGEAAVALLSLAKAILKNGAKVFGNRLFYAAIDFELGEMTAAEFGSILLAELLWPGVLILGGVGLVGLTVWDVLGCPTLKTS